MSTTAFVLTLLVLCYAVVSGLVKRWYIAPALIFVLFGMALGPFGLGLIDVGTKASNFTLPAQLALTVILFNQASTHDLSAAGDRHPAVSHSGHSHRRAPDACHAVVGGDLPRGDRGSQRGRAH